MSSDPETSVTNKHAGCFFVVVGPSGAGKDSLMDGARQQLSSEQFIFAKRVITRPPGMVGEDYQSCNPDEFEARVRQNAFLMTWQAHGYRYGLETSLLDQQTTGMHIIANGSRSVVEDLTRTVPNLVVVNVVAPIELLAERLAKRGRENKEEITKRLHRDAVPFPDGIEVITVNNDASLTEGIERFTAAVKARAELTATKI